MVRICLLRHDLRRRFAHGRSVHSLPAYLDSSGDLPVVESGEPSPTGRSMTTDQRKGRVSLALSSEVATLDAIDTNRKLLWSDLRTPRRPDPFHHNVVSLATADID